MRILALEHEVAGATAAQFKLHANAEAARAWELVQSGLVREIHMRADRNDAVLVLECASVEQAQSILATLPMVQAGLTLFDVIPLKPYPGFARLFAAPHRVGVLAFGSNRRTGSTHPACRFNNRTRVAACPVFPRRGCRFDLVQQCGLPRPHPMPRRQSDRALAICHPPDRGVGAASTLFSSAGSTRPHPMPRQQSDRAHAISLPPDRGVGAASTRNDALTLPAAREPLRPCSAVRAPTHRIPCRASSPIARMRLVSHVTAAWEPLRPCSTVRAPTPASHAAPAVRSRACDLSPTCPRRGSRFDLVQQCGLPRPHPMPRRQSDLAHAISLPPDRGVGAAPTRNNAPTLPAAWEPLRPYSAVRAPTPASHAAPAVRSRACDLSPT